MDYVMKREIIAEKVAYGIIDFITRQSLQPGDKLLSEEELSRLFMVGRPAIREAIRALHMMNIVDIRHGDGIYISSLEPKNFINPFIIYMELGKITIGQLFETRIALEVEGIGIAAGRITDEQINELDRIMVKSKQCIGSAIDFAQTDICIHNIIFNASNNPMLESLMIGIKDLTVKGREITGQYQETREMVHNDHGKIVNALKKRDEDLCKKEMKSHLLNMKNIAEINEKVFKSKLAELIHKM